MDKKQFAIERVDRIARDMLTIRDRLFAFAELPYREFKSAELLGRVLRQYGFAVTEGAAGIPTCFYGEFSNGEGGMTVGFLGEYDALDGLSQKAGCTVRDPVKPNAPGHGCGHCCLGVGALAAAVVSDRRGSARQGDLFRLSRRGRGRCQAVHGPLRAL